MEFDYRTASPSMYAGFSVIWGNRKALDNPDDIHGQFGFGWINMLNTNFISFFSMEM